MNWISNIFGSETVINGAVSGIDKMFYTDQERSEMKVKLLDAYRPFKLIQRVLATVVALLFAFVLITEVTLVIIGIWFPITIETAVQINELEVVQMLGWGFVAVMSLYFSAGAINSFKGKA